MPRISRFRANARKVFAVIRRQIEGDVRLIWRFPRAKAVLPPAATDFVFHRFARRDAVPQTVWSDLCHTFGSGFEREAHERLTKGARLFVAYRGPDLVGVSWGRSNIEHWLIPLDPRDTVLYGASTVPKFRGLGFRAHFVPWIAYQEFAAGAANIYADTQQANHAARHNVEKLGYDFVTRVRLRNRGLVDELIAARGPVRQTS